MPIRILCVDDEDDICQLLDTILTMCGYSTLIASTASDALAGARDRPDLIILDINLPDQDGIEVCRQVRRIDPRVPVLFLTAATGARQREAMGAGGSAFLEKPFDVDELLGTIDGLLARRHERRSGRDRRERMDGHLGGDRRDVERRSMWQDRHAHASDGRVRNGVTARGHPSPPGRPGREVDRRPVSGVRGREPREA